MSAKPTFEAIVATHGAAVLRVCRAVVGVIEADDVWSETFLSAMGAYPELPVDANVEAWLVTIAHRRAIDAVRKAARRPTPTAAIADTATAADPDQAGADSPLADALLELPTKQRHVVAYHYLGGLPYADVAAIVGGSAAAARRAAADAIATLRRTYPRRRSEKDNTDEHRT